MGFSPLPASPELKNKIIKRAKLTYPTRFYDEKNINILINSCPGPFALHKRTKKEARRCLRFTVPEYIDYNTNAGIQKTGSFTYRILHSRVFVCARFDFVAIFGTKGTVLGFSPQVLFLICKHKRYRYSKY